MNKKEKRKAYEEELSKWKAENLGRECFYLSERTCVGHYAKFTAYNRLECDKCGTGLVFQTFEETVAGRRQSAMFEVSDAKSRLAIKRKERDNIDAQIRVLKEDLKIAKQKLRKWG